MARLIPCHPARKVVVDLLSQIRIQLFGKVSATLPPLPKSCPAHGGSLFVLGYRAQNAVNRLNQVVPAVVFLL